MKRTILSILLLLPMLSLQASEQVYERINAELTYCGADFESISERMVMAVEGMIDTPYQEGILEHGTKEELVIELTKTDCILFVESALALTHNSLSSYPSFRNFSSIVKELRYRRGIVNGYSSRIHYTSEWISQGVKNGYFREITAQLGGEKVNQEFSFMSNNAKLYKQLSSSQTEIIKIRSIERQLSSQGGYSVIAKNKVKDITSQLVSGDIIAFTSRVKGLDISHVGVVYIDGDRVTFIHASSSAGMVIIHPTSLVEYLDEMSSISGIRVIRL